MDYNWGDPKKNSLLSSRMMAKAEMTRKKRLTSVRSTLSNQLHPSIEHKLRKKKKTPDSARINLSGEDDCNNNESHENLTQSADLKKAMPQVVSDDESGSLDTIRHDAFPVPARSSYANVSMFDEFGLNAAADGLFHPASTIEAFTEHDAKYHQEIPDTSDKPRSGPRRARSGSEYPPSRENHRLPALHSGKSKRDRLSTRPESKLHPAGKNGSAPASISTTSSLSNLLDAEDSEEGKRSLSATQSDSNLYAPRRLDVVPPSADRNALDFFEGELDSDSNNNPHNSPEVKFLCGVSELDNNEIPDDCSSVVPPLDFSLASKFDELKRITKSNREKRDSARQSSEDFKNGVRSSECVAGHQSSARPKSSSTSDQGSTKSAIRAPASGSSGSKTGGETSKVESTLKKRSTQAACASSEMNSGPSSAKRVVANQAATRKMPASGTVAIIPSTKSKREMKVRSGVSLSDLKAEHREALQMLKELGGPLDPDYMQTDLESNSSKGLRVGKMAVRTTGNNRLSGAMLSVAGGSAHNKSTNQLQARASAATPATSANSSVSMVTKLRESISSGRRSRGSSRESSPRTSSSDDTSAKDKKSESTSMVPVAQYSHNSLPSPSQGSAKVAADEIMDTRLGELRHDTNASGDPETAISSLSPPPLTPTSTAVDPWKQYEDDMVDGDDEDNNELERDSSSEPRLVFASGDRYSDEDFESDW